MKHAFINLDKTLTPEERAAALLNISIKTPEHLKKWLEQSGREFLIFKATDLVDALKWPEGVDLVMQLIAVYRDYRATLPSGRVERQPNPVTGDPVDVPQFKSDTLEPDEMERLVAHLVTEMGSES